MSKPITEVVFAVMQPRTYYRPRDIPQIAKVDANSASSALRQLARGGSRSRQRWSARGLYHQSIST